MEGREWYLLIRLVSHLSGNVLIVVLTLIQMAILGLLTLVAEDAYGHENVGVCVLGHQC